jgi:hypothetical protein
MDTVIAMLHHYSFDLGGYTTDDLARIWQKFEPSWVRLAIVESLFQGRYKAVSVNQILTFWERKGEPHCRFNREFERLVCGDFVTASPSGFSNHPQKVVYKIAKAEVPKSGTHGTTDSSQRVSYPKTSPLTPPPSISRIPVPPKAPSHTTQHQNPNTSLVSHSPVHVSDVYRSAMENMQLFADSSLFVDKLKSMCQGCDFPVNVALKSTPNLTQDEITTLQSVTKISLSSEPIIEPKVLVEAGIQSEVPALEVKAEPEMEAQIQAIAES